MSRSSLFFSTCHFIAVAKSWTYQTSPPDIGGPARLTLDVSQNVFRLVAFASLSFSGLPPTKSVRSWRQKIFASQILVLNKEDVKSAFQLAKNLRPVFGHSPKGGSQTA